MIIKKLEVGPLMANCFILGCENTKEAAIIDPGGDTEQILIESAGLKLKIKYIINTHGHFDHVAGNKKIKKATNATLAIHTEDEFMLSDISRAARMFGISAEDSPAPDLLLNDGDNINFGTITLNIIHTPGHSRGGISLYTPGHLFAGDTLFAGSIGRTDFRGGDYDTLISSVKKKLFILPDNTVVHTGHGPETSIGNEKRTNPFLQ